MLIRVVVQRETKKHQCQPICGGPGRSLSRRMDAKWTNEDYMAIRTNMDHNGADDGGDSVNPWSRE